MPVVDGLENDIAEIEAEVFGGDPNVSRRIYELSREVIEFQRATEPLGGVLENMIQGRRRTSTRRQGGICATSKIISCRSRNGSAAFASYCRASSA